MLDNKGVSCALADGISTSQHGKQASQACVTGFLSDYYSTPDTWSVKQAGGKVLTAINTWLHGQSQQFRDASRGLASTFSTVVIKSTTAHLFHVGDSRIYLYRNGELEQLTVDHRIRVDETHSYLGRAMGVDYRLDIDYKMLSVEEGDIFLLTTDGVHDVLPDRTIRQLLNEPDTNLSRIAEKIGKLAYEQGSQDNISCQMLRVEQLPTQDANEVFAQLTELPFPPDLSEGMILDGYRIAREIHASSTSQLYLAVDTETGQKVVIKTPSVNFEDDPAYLERFQLEEWIGKRIDNPHVIRTVEQRRNKQFLYNVMEYLEGKTLEQWLDDEGVLSLDQIRTILPQMISGVRAFHRLDMLHQDLKPGNIMISHDGVIKIIDFGSTKIAGIADIASPIQRKELLGTKHFTAPEYLMGEAGVPQSDQFALGCIIYQLLTGQLPYGEHLVKHASQQTIKRLRYTPINEYRKDVPHWVDKAIRKAVSINPEQRYEKLSELDADMLKPNPIFLREEQLPILERNPIAFWRTTSLLLLASNLALLYLLVH
jgi:serine/threonine protein kinase